MKRSMLGFGPSDCCEPFRQSFVAGLLRRPYFILRVDKSGTTVKHSVYDYTPATFIVTVFEYLLK